MYGRLIVAVFSFLSCKLMFTATVKLKDTIQYTNILAYVTKCQKHFTTIIIIHSYLSPHIYPLLRMWVDLGSANGQASLHKDCAKVYRDLKFNTAVTIG